MDRGPHGLYKRVRGPHVNRPLSWDDEVGPLLITTADHCQETVHSGLQDAQPPSEDARQVQVGKGKKNSACNWQKGVPRACRNQLTMFGMHNPQQQV